VRRLLPTWQPIAMQPLPFVSTLVGSHNDPFCRFERAQALAQAWGSALHDMGDAGHINAESGLGDWSQGLAWLHDMLVRAEAATPATCATQAGAGLSATPDTASARPIKGASEPPVST
jgi:hypothetical protein